MISRREDRSGSFLREFKSLGRNLFLIMYLGIISVALIVVLYRLDSYAEQLLVFFICWLISFHILLFVFRNVVSRRLIRATDYVYFLFVFIGLVMAAYAQQAERSETYMRLISVLPIKDDTIKTWIAQISNECPTLAVNRPDIIEPIRQLNPAVEIRPDEKPLIIPTEVCAILRELNSTISNNNYKKLYDELGTQNIFIASPWLWSQRRQDETPASAYLFLSNASLMAQILVSRNYPTDLFGLMPRDQKMHTLIAKYLVIDLWPFVLAFAIAIRITRVTSDVTGWPRDGKE